MKNFITILITLTISTKLYANTKTLKLHDVHLNKKITSTFYKNGKYIEKEIQKLNKFLKDRRTNEYTKIHYDLYNLLHDIQKNIAKNEYISFVSAYRSQKTNKDLTKKFQTVSKKSLHTQGKAIDIRVSGVKLSKLKKYVMSLKKGGVGYYPDKDNNFVHIDVGRVRYW